MCGLRAGAPPSGRLMDVAAIVAAAGSGRRFGGSTKKTLVPLGGVPLIVHALTTLRQEPLIGRIALVVGPEELVAAQELVGRRRLKDVTVCAGGASRGESVARGFAALGPRAKWVLVHDGARPCVSRRVIRRAIAAAKRHGAVACGLPASATIKAVDDRCGVRLTLDRDRLWMVQTPQVFRRSWFARALEQAGGQLSELPDDAAVLESVGLPVRMVLGDPLNIKVTTKEDLLLAEAILAASEPRHATRNGRHDGATWRMAARRSRGA